MAGSVIDLSFPHHWTAEVLKQRPMILPTRQFVYPQQVEEVERGALEVLVRPGTSSQGTLNRSARPAPGPFLATCALGFADPAAPSGVWSCPDPATLCAVAGGYAYLIDTTQPEQWQQVEYRPVLSVHPLPEQGLLLFAGHHALTAWGVAGKAWQSARLSWEGVQIVGVDGWTLKGTGWDLMTDRETTFQLDLHTGEHTAGLRSDG